MSLRLAVTVHCLLLLLPALAAAQTFDPAARAAAIAPYVDDLTTAVIHIDPARIDLAETRKLLVSKLPMVGRNELAEVEKAEGQTTAWVAALRKAGLQDLYLIVSLADVPARPPFVVARLTKEADPIHVGDLLLAGPQQFEAEDRRKDPTFETAVVKGNLCIGHANTLARLKEQKPVEKADLAAGFKIAGDTAIQVVLLQSADTRRVLVESLPKLPGELGEYSGQDLADGMQYAALGIDFPPKMNVKLGVQSRDEASAARLQALVKDAFAIIGADEQVKKMYPRFDDLVKVLTPKQEGDRLTLELNEQNGGVAQAIGFLSPPVQAARDAAQRTQSMNNLKQLALAMHIYHDTHRAFPAQASAKDGKPLLSWRVQILPYIEEQKLYDEFHHDEPWDSEHNQQLIAKMPKLYASPGVKLEAGETIYLVPAGKSLVFHGDKGAKMADITDGTSNTLMIVEASADQAVPWTKPADLEVDLDKPAAGLGGVRGEGFLAALCDGSVRFIKTTIDAKTLRNLFEKADNNPIQGF